MGDGGRSTSGSGRGLAAKSTGACRCCSSGTSSPPIIHHSLLLLGLVACSAAFSSPRVRQTYLRRFLPLYSALHPPSRKANPLLLLCSIYCMSGRTVEVPHLPHLPLIACGHSSDAGLTGLYLCTYLASSASPSPTRRCFGHHRPPTTTQRQPLFALEKASPSTPPLHSPNWACHPHHPLPPTLSIREPCCQTTHRKKPSRVGDDERTRKQEKSKANAEAPDGKMLEAVYSSRAGRRIPTLETASTEKEARRVLAWQQDVARSTAASVVGDDPRPPPYRRAETFPRMAAERPPRLVRRETVTTEHYHNERERATLASRGGGGNGFTGMKLVGTLLGAAAGAAVAYAMVRSESPSRIAPPPRRASYGDHGSEYTHTRPIETVRSVERVPARSYVSAKEPPRYVEYRIAPPPAPTRALAQDLARIEERSHVSRRSPRNSERGSRERSKSEVRSTRYDRPLTTLPPRPRSPGASHVSHHTHQSHYTKRDSDRESYASARSQRTDTTVKPVQYVTATPRKVSTTTIRVVPRDEERRSEVSYARHVPLPRSEVSARHVPLPPSMVSRRSYTPSVAPSDSVSSIGSKRERERLLERMSARDRW